MTNAEAQTIQPGDTVRCNLRTSTCGVFDVMGLLPGTATLWFVDTQGEAHRSNICTLVSRATPAEARETR